MCLCAFDPVLCLAGDLVGLFLVGRFSVCPEAAILSHFLFNTFLLLFSVTETRLNAS